MRAIGVVWIVAGAGIVRQTWQIYRMEKLTDELDGLIEADASDDAENRSGPQEDRQRNVWIGIGGVLTFQTGCALVAASGLSAPLSFILCVHQTAYVARQRSAAVTRHMKKMQPTKLCPPRRGTPLFLPSSCQHWRSISPFQACMADARIGLSGPQRAVRNGVSSPCAGPRPAGSFQAPAAQRRRSHRPR